MRINFSSKTKGSGKITPFYTIKAGKSRVCKMTKNVDQEMSQALKAIFYECGMILSAIIFFILHY